MRRQTGTPGRAFDHASISVSRLLEIAKGMFDLKIEGHAWARPRSLAARSPRSVSRVISASPLPRHIAHLHRPLAVHGGPLGRLAKSQSSRNTCPPALLLGSPRIKIPALRRDYGQVAQRRGEAQANQQTNATAPASQQPHLGSVNEFVSMEAMAGLLGPQLFGISQISGARGSPSEHIRGAGFHHVAIVAPSPRNHGVGQPLGARTRAAKISPPATPTAPSLQSSMSLRLRTDPNKSNEIRDSAADPNKNRRGDLFLEGAALGRWLTQYLNREIMRPRYGIMAVDPRVAPSWGGPSLSE